MATRSANRSNSSRNRGNSNRESAFSWGSPGAIAGAALGGAALAIAANIGRKFMSQAFVSGHGDWVESLTALAEEPDGSLVLLRHDGGELARLPARAAAAPGFARAA